MIASGVSNRFEVAGVAAALTTAQQSGLIEALLDGPAAASTYAARLGLDPAEAAQVLEVLSAVGLADRTDGTYGAAAALKDFAAVMSPAVLGMNDVRYLLDTGWIKVEAPGKSRRSQPSDRQIDRVAA
jgi:hypothetical protein